MKKPTDPNDYELEDEYDLTQMAVLPKGRNDQTHRAGAESRFIAPDLVALAPRAAEIVVGDARVLLVYAFGSTARGDTGPMSDLDIAVLLTHAAPVASLRSELTHAFSALSDGIPVDLIILNEASIELAYSVICEGKVLYERTIADRVEYEAAVLSRYGDYLPFLRAQREAILKGAGNDRRIQRYREALGRTERTLGALGAAKRTTAR